MCKNADKSTFPLKIPEITSPIFGLLTNICLE